jgi:hypothetical protein
MALLGRRRSPVCGLLTAVISAGGHDGGWDVTWIGDGRGCKEPEGFVAASLSGAVEQATVSALSLYSARELAPSADLQFAIYPWDYGKDAPIYDIILAAGEFRAENMLDNSGPRISASSLEGLVAELRKQPAGNAAMLRWGRPFADLSAGGPES